MRIDDSDADRKRPEYVEDIFRTIEWLGLDYDLGPQGPDDFEKRFSQRHRLDLYHSVLEELKRVPGLVYACSCSRKEIQQQSTNGLYPGSCRNKHLPLNIRNSALRVHLPVEREVGFNELLCNEPIRLPIGQQMGDFVIQRKDGLPSYQLVSLADDMLYGVNLIVRGKDLLNSTGAQLFLAQCMEGLGEDYRNTAHSFLNAQFLHHPLILNPEGEKLSKSKGSASVLEMRRSGKGPQEIFSKVAFLAGLGENRFSHLQDLLQAFDIRMLQKNSPNLFQP